MKRTARALAAMAFLAILGLTGVATRTHAQVLTTGTIAGTVTDPSGKSLPGVQITLDSGQLDVTNANGAFTITDVLPGTHTVTASLVGYRSITATNVVVTQELTTNIALQFQTVERTSTGVQTIIAPLIHKNVTPTLYTVTSKEEQLVRSQPNNLYQYPGALISQPGIVPDQDGYPTVRGSKIDEVNYMVDGISVVKPTNNGFGSNLVTVGLDRMNVYTGGYRAELGSAIGGVVNAVIKTGASMRGAAVEATTGSWDYSGVVYEQGNVENNGFNWYVSGNFFRTGFEKNSAVESLPASADVIAKLIQPIGKDRFTFLYNQGFEHYVWTKNDPITGLPWGADPAVPGSGDQAIHDRIFDRGANDWVATTPAQDYQPQGYNIQSLTWSHPFSSSANLSAQAYRLQSAFQIHAGSFYNWIDYFDETRLGAGRVDYSNQMNDKLAVRIGGEFNRSENYNQIVYIPEVTPSLLNAVRGKIPTNDMNAYVSTTLKPSNRLTVDLGVRYDSRVYHHKVSDAYLNEAKPGIAEADLAVLAKTGRDPKLSQTTPRAGMTYLLRPGTLLKASGGRFIQMPGTLFMEQIFLPANTDTIDPETGRSSNAYIQNRRKVADLKPQLSDGWDLGLEQQFGKYIGLAVTPYYRKIKQQVVRGQIEGHPEWGNAYQSLGHGHVHGVETKLEMRERNGLSGWITYTNQIGKNNSPGSQAGTTLTTVPALATEEHRNNYDQRHTVYVVGQYKTGNFEINPMLELGSGYPYGGEGEPYMDAPPASGAPAGTTIPVLINGKVQDVTKINAYNTGWHRNLSVTFRLYNDTKKSSYYFLQVQNILNYKDVTSRYLLDPTSGNPVGYQPGSTTYTDENGNQQTSAYGAYYYKPYTTVPPVFVLLGVHTTF